MDIPYISAQDLNALNLTAHEIIAAIEGVIKGAADGTVWAAPKAAFSPPNDDRYMMAALAAMDGPSVLAVKTVVLNPLNPDNGLPQINGLVTCLDSATGLPLAILDGNWITAVRTAGLSATAAKYMANPDAATIGFVGTGVQAHSHLDAFSQMFPLKHLKMFGRGKPNKVKLAEAGEKLGLTVEECAAGQDVADQVDLLVTTVNHTGGAAPFLNATTLREGSFTTVVDLAAPWERESFAALDHVIVDDVIQEAAMSNKLCDPSVIAGDVSGLVTGKATGRSSTKDRTAFVFRGHALGDLALSTLALERHGTI